MDMKCGSCRWEMRNEYKIFISKPEETRLSERPRSNGKGKVPVLN